NHPQHDLSIVHVVPDRPFADLAVGQFLSNPLPDPMRRVPLLAWRLAVGFQNCIHELHRRLHLPARSFRFLPPLRQRVSDRLTHHTPVHSTSQLLTMMESTVHNTGQQPEVVTAEAGYWDTEEVQAAMHGVRK